MLLLQCQSVRHKRHALLISFGNKNDKSESATFLGHLLGVEDGKCLVFGESPERESPFS